MTKIFSIVAATDFSPGSSAAVERAVQLAVAHGASLRLLHAFDVSAWHSLKGVFDPQRLTLSPPPDVRMQQHLTDLAASLMTQTGLEVEARFTVGDADSAINAYVTAYDISLVVIGSRAEPAMPGLGSTASKVVRSPACPILIVRSTVSRPYDKVLSAVDMRDGSIRAASGAIMLFPAAHHHLLYAVDPALERALWMGDVAREQTQVLHDSMHAKAVRQLEQLAQELTKDAVHQVTAEVVDDVPARAIALRAAALPADCVAVGHHGQGAVAEHLLGSMAQHVLHHTLRDVLVVP
ncbi:MAG: universal stress protein [Polaromonas sp.]|nr:universal stress protein [Polaromonas sp.]